MKRRLSNFSSTRLVLLATAVIVGYFLVTGATTALRSHQLSERQDRLRADIEAMQARYERLQPLREYLDSPQFVETVAREQLGLVGEGETAIVVISTEPAPPDGGQGEGEQLWWHTLTR